MKTADGSKLFLAIFEKTYDGLYICHFLFDKGCDFTLLHLKRALKIPTKNGLSVLWSHLSGRSF